MKLAITQSYGPRQGIDFLKQTYVHFFTALDVALIPVSNALPDPAATVEALGADGLILSGGGDVSPARYGASNAGSREITRDRDRTEWALLNWAVTRGKLSLERAGITAGVNLRAEFDDLAYGLALEHYCHLPTVDDDAIAAEDLERGVAFIRQQIDAGRKVYIHCAGGVGRAPTLAAAYLISTGMTLDEALAKIRRVRPFIFITSPQMAALTEYEAQQRAQVPALER